MCFTSHIQALEGELIGKCGEVSSCFQCISPTNGERARMRLVLHKSYYITNTAALCVGTQHEASVEQPHPKTRTGWRSCRSTYWHGCGGCRGPLERVEPRSFVLSVSLDVPYVLLAQHITLSAVDPAAAAAAAPAEAAASAAASLWQYPA